MSNAAKIGFVSLGCPKALVDSERILTQLRAEGYDFTPDYREADCIIVNTCGFIDSAVDESLDAIEEALTQNGKVIVTGCLGAKSEVIRARFAGVLNISGPQDFESVMNAVHQQCPPPHDPFSSLIPDQGVKLTPKHYAYLKISEGCNQSCSFCIIPSMRGKLKSRPANETLLEADKLVKAGVKELLVIAQDTAAYGLDLKYAETHYNGKTVKTQLQDFVENLGDLGVWIRLLYLYPYPHIDKVLPLMRDNKILPYLDIPFQHASPHILKLMKRPAATEKILDRIHTWRDICPDITIRSTFIVGFPGETDKEFEELLDFLDSAQLDRVGCFAYSPVEGAKANELDGAVPEDIKQERLQYFMEKQAAISEKKLHNKIGTLQDVIIDEVNEDHAVGRSKADAPEIDGVVIIENPMGLKAGEIIKVKITDSTEHDLIASCNVLA